MILLDVLASFLDNLALPELMMAGTHVLEVDTQDPSRSASNFKLGESFVPLEVDFDILYEIECEVLSFLIDEGIVV